MEPTIYKPGAYKTPGIYKGAGGIYNGRGVYNYGDVVIPWVVLNNCDNLDNNKCISIVGNDLYNDSISNFGLLEDSQNFIGTKSIRRINSTYVAIRDILIDNDVFTIEFYVSGLPNSYSDFDVYALKCFCMTNNNSNGLYVGCENAHDFITDYPVVNWTGKYYAMKLPIITKGHFAAVVNKLNGIVTAFLDGSKIGSYKYGSINNVIAQNGSSGAGVIEFFAVRNGDFSNNLEYFTVPTQKYSL